MKLNTNLAAVISGTAIISAIVLTIPRIVLALSPTEVNKIAKEITVLIDGQNPGSGVIIARQGNTYYVLTAEHVVHTPDEYTIVTPDQQKYPLNYKIVKKVPSVDLAVLQFTSNKNYSIAKIGDSNKVSEGADVHIAGFANPGQGITERICRFTHGEISGLQKPGEARDGYALVYTNVTKAGMSGGPVLDDSGRLIGIHGRAEGEEVAANESGGSSTSKSGFNLGIPISTFMSLEPKVGLNLGLRVDNSPPTQQATPATASPEVQATTPTIPSAPAVLYRRPTPVRATDVPDSPVCAGIHC